MKPIDYKHVGKCVKRARVESGLSKRKFAQFLGIHNAHIAHRERGVGNKYAHYKDI